MHLSLKWEAFKNGNTKTQPDKEIRKKRKWWSGARGGRLFQPTIKQKCSFRLACLRFIEPCLAMCCTIHYKAFKSPSECVRPCTVCCENTETTHSPLAPHRQLANKSDVTLFYLTLQQRFSIPVLEKHIKCEERGGRKDWNWEPLPYSYMGSLCITWCPSNVQWW